MLNVGSSTLKVDFRTLELYYEDKWRSTSLKMRRRDEIDVREPHESQEAGPPEFITSTYHKHQNEADRNEAE